MGHVHYEPNRAGMAALANGPQMSAAMLAIANAAVPYAVSISPRGHTGAYSEAFRVVAVPVKVGRANEMRAGAMIVNVSPYAAGLEWRHGAAVLAKTARHIDGRLHGAERAGFKAEMRDHARSRAPARRASQQRPDGPRRPSQR